MIFYNTYSNICFWIYLLSSATTIPAHEDVKQAGCATIKEPGDESIAPYFRAWNDKIVKNCSKI